MGTVDDLIQERFDAYERQIQEIGKQRRETLFWNRMINDMTSHKKEFGKYPRIYRIFEDEEEAFLKCSEFVNASEYNEESVKEIEDGEIGQYLGAKIIVLKRMKP